MNRKAHNCLDPEPWVYVQKIRQTMRFRSVLLHKATIVASLFIGQTRRAPCSSVVIAKCTTTSDDCQEIISIHKGDKSTRLISQYADPFVMIIT
jgi:hypothetical protein